MGDRKSEVFEKIHKVYVFGGKLPAFEIIELAAVALEIEAQLLGIETLGLIGKSPVHVGGAVFGVAHKGVTHV